MGVRNRLMPNGKLTGEVKEIKEFQNRIVNTCSEFNGLEIGSITKFDFKSLQELYNICIDKSYPDNPKIHPDDLHKIYEQMKLFSKNVVLLTRKSFVDRLCTIPIYDLNSLSIQAIRMSLNGLEFFANSIQVLSYPMKNTIDLNTSPKGSVTESALEICKAYHTNIIDSPVNIKSSNLAQIKHLSDSGTHGSSTGNLGFFSNMYNQVKSIHFKQIRDSRMKSSSSSQPLLEHIHQQYEDEDIIRRNVILKIDVNNSWLLLETVLRYSEQRQIPVVVVYNLRLEIVPYEKPVSKFLRENKLHYGCFYANRFYRHNSNLLIFYMAQPDLNFHMKKSHRYHPKINQENNFIMVDINFNGAHFQIMAIYGSIMSELNEELLYLDVKGKFSDTPTILIVQSARGRFHKTCANGDLVLQLTNEDLLNELENTDGTLIYITREFPEEIRNIIVFTGEIRYRRRKEEDAKLTSCAVITAMPLNQ